MSPFSIKFQANWRKLKIRPFFRTSEISLTYKFYYHHHVQDTQYTLNTNFQANRKKLKIGRFFRTVEISLTHKFYYHHHFQDTRYTQNTKFQANRTRLKFREFSEFRAKNEKSQIFFISAIVLRIPYIPHIQNFKLIGQSWKFGRFFGRSKFRSHTNFIITIIFRIPDIPKIQISSQSDKVEISWIQRISCENEKSQNFFISAIVLRIPDIPCIPNFKRIGQSWKFGRFFGRPKFRELFRTDL